MEKLLSTVSIIGRGVARSLKRGRQFPQHRCVPDNQGHSQKFKKE